MKPIQAVLLMAVIGLVVLQVWGLWTSASVSEPFEDLVGPPPFDTTPVDPTYRTVGPNAIHPAADVSPPELDPRDIPWVESWSAADHAARDGNNCNVHGQELGPDGTFIHTVSKTCEAGMAHTRAGDRIVMPDSIPMAMWADTLRHEMFHIYQRRWPAEWREFYRRQWRFEFHEEPPADMPASVIGARRSNPDTWDPATGGPWACWKGRYWPVPVYRDPQRPQLRDARTVWWDATMRKVLLEPPADWVAFFGRPDQEEHPHEIAAVLLATGDNSSEAGRRILSWWQLQGPFMSKPGSKALY